MRKALRSCLACSSLFVCLSLGVALGSKPATADTTVTADDRSPSPSALERGHQLLAEKRYDEAIKEFKAALELKPTAETHVALATALLRGRRVLQSGDFCDPRSFRAELLAHRAEKDQAYDGCRLSCQPVSHPILLRHYELNSAIGQLEVATKLEPENIAIYEQLICARIALTQFDEEAACRQAQADVCYGTETDLGRITRMDSFELPSLQIFYSELYSLDANHK